MSTDSTILETLEYVAATLKLRHINEATDDEVDEALTMAKDAITEARHGPIVNKHTSKIQARDNTLLDALRAVLPYAESELESLDECQRRDGGLEDEVAACEAAVEQAKRVLAEAARRPV